MARIAPLPTDLRPLVRLDGEWLRCAAAGCGDRAFWGAFRPTAFVLAKAQDHWRRIHGAQQRKAKPAAAARPQRRNAAAAVGLGVSMPPLGKRLGQGVARVGYELDGEYIIKVAKQGQAKHNLAEARIYASAPANVRKFLCPVLAVHPKGEWIIMRKAQMAESLGWHKADSIRDAVADAIGDWCHDLHGGNVGLVDGQPVATDYAGGMFVRMPQWAVA